MRKVRAAMIMKNGTAGDGGRKKKGENDEAIAGRKPTRKKLEARQNDKSELYGETTMRQPSTTVIEKDGKQRNKRQHGNEQKSRGHRNESNGNDENETQTREALDAAGKFTNDKERAAE
jgi:hypothetical protein